MGDYLSTLSLPRYKFSAYKKFKVGEKHITRLSADSVLIIAFGGKLYFTENGVERCVLPGEYYIQMAGFHQSALRESELADYYYVHFSGEFDQNQEGLKISGKFNEGAILPLIYKLEKEQYSPQKDEISLNAYFYQILSELKKGDKNLVQPLAEKILDVIAENFRTQITIEDIAKKLYVTTNKAIEVFKKEYGETPYKYVTKLRIAYAKTLLRSTSLTAEEVGNECGFTDFTVFYKAFFKKEKISPTKWKSLQNIK